LSEKKENLDAPFGLSENGIPLTKSGRENRTYHKRPDKSKLKQDGTPRKRMGRPPKVSLTPQEKRPVGRPKGDAAIINEYKARMLASPKSAKVLDAIFNAALNDDHKNQASAWKLVMDRVAPVAAFEKDIVKGGGKSSIQINITGVGQPEIAGEQEQQEEQDYEEGEYTIV